MRTRSRRIRWAVLVVPPLVVILTQGEASELSAAIYPEAGPAACFLRIGMPIRNSFWGFISADQAAMYSAKVTNMVAGEMEGAGRFALPPGIFCSEFFTNVKKMFAEQYKNLGVVVNKS